MTDSPFAAAAKAKRRALNLSQAGLADAAGVSRVTVTRIERGDGVHSNSLLAVLGALGLAVQINDQDSSPGMPSAHGSG